MSCFFFNLLDCSDTEKDCVFVPGLFFDECLTVLDCRKYPIDLNSFRSKKIGELFLFMSNISGVF